MTTRLIGNVRFHVAMAVAAQHTKLPAPGVKQLEVLVPADVEDATLVHATDLVLAEFNALGSTDAVAKSADFSERVASRLATDLKPEETQA